MPCDWCVDSPAIGRPSGPADFAAIAPETEMAALKVSPGAPHMTSDSGGGSKVPLVVILDIGTLYLPEKSGFYTSSRKNVIFLVFLAHRI